MDLVEHGVRVTEVLEQRRRLDLGHRAVGKREPSHVRHDVDRRQLACVDVDEPCERTVPRAEVEPKRSLLLGHAPAEDTAARISIVRSAVVRHEKSRARAGPSSA